MNSVDFCPPLQGEGCADALWDKHKGMLKKNFRRLIKQAKAQKRSKNNSEEGSGGAQDDGETTSSMPPGITHEPPLPDATVEYPSSSSSSAAVVVAPALQTPVSARGPRQRLAQLEQGFYGKEKDGGLFPRLLALERDFHGEQQGTLLRRLDALEKDLLL